MKRLMILLASVLITFANVQGEEIVKIVSAQKVDISGDTKKVLEDWGEDSGVIKLKDFEVDVIKGGTTLHFIQTSDPKLDYGKTDKGVGYRVQTIHYYCKEEDKNTKISTTLFDDGKYMVSIYFIDNGLMYKYMVEDL